MNRPSHIEKSRFELRKKYMTVVILGILFWIHEKWCKF